MATIYIAVFVAVFAPVAIFYLAQIASALERIADHFAPEDDDEPRQVPPKRR